MITDVPGVRVGHWTDERAATGCTVALFPAGTVASGEIRGGAPATREWDLLAPQRLVHHLDAVVLAGGSAFGLAACDGVMRFCEQRGMGFPTPGGPVPIVVGAALYDLTVGDGSVRPDAAAGEAACVAATAGPVVMGPVGAGAGATIDKWRGPDHVRPGGVGSAAERLGDVVVGALVAVNAYGSVVAPGDEPHAVPEPVAGLLAAVPNTTIGVVATNATLDKRACLLVAQGAHDGLARVVAPVHTTVDGDGFVAASVGGVESHVDTVRALASRAVVAAVRAAIGA